MASARADMVVSAASDKRQPDGLRIYFRPRKEKEGGGGVQPLHIGGFVGGLSTEVTEGAIRSA